MRCILLIFFEIVKIPREVEVRNIKMVINFPSSVGSENINTMKIIIRRIIADNLL